VQRWKNYSAWSRCRHCRWWPGATAPPRTPSRRHW